MSTRSACAIGLALVLAGCPASPRPKPEVIYRPEAIGTITDLAHNGVTDTWTLTIDGRTLQLDPDDIALYGEPGLDALLLMGSADGHAWYLVLPRRGTGEMAGCFDLASGGAWDERDEVLFAFSGGTGIRLTKAPNWEEPKYSRESDNRFPSWLRDWCLNGDGEVVSVHAV
jgi:hypothetical protein